MGAPAANEAVPSRAPRSVHVAAFQFDVRRGDVASNLAAVERGLGQAAQEGVDLVVLPEMWPTSFVDLEHFESRWMPATEAALERVRRLSEELGLMVAGSAFARPERTGAKPTNRLVVHDRGHVVLTFDKVHLFSPTAEGETFAAGTQPPPTVATRLGKLSGCVCYDLRFAPLLRAPFLEEAEILVVPAQWPLPRGPHWRALLLGRAVECQAFVLGCNRAGVERVGRRGLELHFPGNSFLVDPDGSVLAQGQGAEELVRASIDLGALKGLRRRVPVRRDDRRAWGGGGPAGFSGS